MNAPAGQLEWLETNCLGSFALGCVDRRLRRKYHSLLSVREPGRGDSWNVLAEIRELVSSQGEQLVLSDCLGAGAAGPAELVAFERSPHATHRYRALGVDIERRVRFAAFHDQVELRYRFRGVRAPLRVELEPLLRCRPVHELTHENPFLDGSLVNAGSDVKLHPYSGMPSVAFRVHGANADVVQHGAWHNGVHYSWESERGYEAHEDLFSPGRFAFDVHADGDVTFVVGLDHTVGLEPNGDVHTTPTFGAKLEQAAEQFFMRTRRGRWTVVAGFPWFGPWGRDALISLPGLYLATNDFERASAVLEGMLEARVNGLIPNIPAISDLPANTSSVDATLLFIRAVQWLGAQAGEDRVVRFMPAVCDLLEALADARDPRMRLDDGVGVWTERGPWALTWMDAMRDGQPVTPRAGYAVDIDALAYNAARFALSWAEASHGRFARPWRARLKGAEARFLARFWDDTRGYLADCHDGVHPDGSLRPNQLWALGLPHRALPDPIARAALATVTQELLVPAGLRTLAPRDPAYRGRYVGAQAERDGAYHQGTVWPWLLGIYADAVRELHGRDGLEPRLHASLTFLSRHLDHEGCVGQISEVFEGDAPHAAAGAPAQAWSVAEVYRAFRMLHATR